MPKIEKFEDIKAWQKSRGLVNLIYDITDDNQFSKDWELKNQIRRSAISVMSNVAEGFDRGTDKEFVQFLRIATGSCSEVRSQLYIALDRKYITQGKFDEIYNTATEVVNLINGFIRYLKKNHSQT